MTLYKCELSSNINLIDNSTEYLRCRSQKILETMFNQCFNFEHSIYYGYNKVKITSMKISNFPEIITVKMDCTNSTIKNKIISTSAV